MENQQSQKVLGSNLTSEVLNHKSGGESCPCCGSLFDSGPHRIHGPYDTGPYRYACEDCWTKPYLFFPDKEIAESGLTRVPSSSQVDMSMPISGPSIQTVSGSAVHFSITPESALEGEIAQVELSSIRLDPNNVRFRDRRRALDDKEIEEVIWSEYATKNLLKEILASRGLSEMPIVDSQLIVREGNRRIVCLRRLSKLVSKGKLAGIENDIFNRVRCVVLKPSTSEKDLAIYLARVHVGGKRQWLAVNKAAHVFELHTREGMAYEEIQRFLSLNRATIERMILAFRDTLAYREKYPDDAGWATKYSYFDEIYKREILRHWIQRKRNRYRLMDWTYKGRIRTGFDIRKLPAILQDRYATRILDKFDVEKAFSVLAKRDPSLTDGFYARISDVITGIKSLDRGELILAANDPSRTRLIHKLLENSARLEENVKRVRELNRNHRTSNRVHQTRRGKRTGKV